MSSKRPAAKAEGGDRKKVSTMRDGDWLCADCDSHNYNARMTCFRCSMPKEKSELKTKGKSALDWICFLCNATNFGFRRECFKCRVSKEESEDRKARVVGRDWFCMDCNVNNFPDRGQCFKCKRPRHMLERPKFEGREPPFERREPFHRREPQFDRREPFDRRDHPRDEGSPFNRGRGGGQFVDRGRSRDPAAPFRRNSSPPRVSGGIIMAPPPAQQRSRTPPPGPSTSGQVVPLTAGVLGSEEWKCDVCDTSNGLRRDSCYKCATARKDEVGEWPCAECHTGNHPNKYLCFRCNAPRPEETHGPVADRRDYGPDWECGFCKVAIFPTRDDCYKCGRSREECQRVCKCGAILKPGTANCGWCDTGGSAAAGDPKWTCLECGLNNFPLRVDCFKCGRPKVEESRRVTLVPAMVDDARPGRGTVLLRDRVPHNQQPLQSPHNRAGPYNGGPRERSPLRGRSPPLIRGPPPVRGGGGMVEMGPPRKPLKPGEWICGKCKVNNYPRRVKCFRCEASRMEVDPLLKEGRALQAGEWTCPSCKGLNYSRRTDCYKCQLPKPGTEKVQVKEMKPKSPEEDKLDLDRDPSGIELSV